MAVPVTITGVNLNVTNMGSCRMGPFRSSAGNFYGVFRDSTDATLLDIYRATDPTDSWSQIASLDVGTANIINWSAHQVGDNLHIAVLDTAALTYSVFSMATDSFTTSNEATGATPVVTDGNNKCGITLRSDGDIIIMYNGAVDTI